jgi:hypothetical protein
MEMNRDALHMKQIMKQMKKKGLWKAQHNTTQDSTAQDSTAQHSTA